MLLRSQGMRKLAAYVCQYNLGSDNLTFAATLSARATVLHTTGCT